MKNLPRVGTWAVVLGILGTLIADMGEWDRFLPNLLWRVLITGVGGLAGIAMNYFASHYVMMGTNVIESMGVVRFSADRAQKIANAFIFMGALLAVIVAIIFIR